MFVWLHTNYINTHHSDIQASDLEIHQVRRLEKRSLSFACR